MKADTICCYCHKQAHDKKDIEESLHAQMIRAKLTACEVGVFSRESRKYAQHFCQEPLKFIADGHILK